MPHPVPAARSRRTPIKIKTPTFVLQITLTFEPNALPAMKKLFLIDAFAIIYRAYYAHARNPLRSSKGFDTSVIYGFMQALREVLHREQPTHIGVAFDVYGETFRHLIDPAYKANRRETPEVIIQSTPVIKEILAAFRIPVLEMQGYEADDLIGTLAKKAEQDGFVVYMMTPDKDYAQLVSPNILIYRPSRFQTPPEKLGSAEVCKRYGVKNPQQVIDVLALWGDTADNVPGAPGIGEKGAIKLIADYGSVENIIARSADLTDRVRQSITDNEMQIRRAKQLVTIDLNVPIEFNEAALLRKDPDRNLLREIFTDLEFKSFLREFCGEGSPAPALPAQSFIFENNDGGAAAESPQRTPSAHIYQTIASVPHTYRALQTADEVGRLAEMLMRQERFCFDTETDGINPLEAAVVGISFAAEGGTAYYVPLNHDGRDEFLRLLRPPLENAAIAKAGQNIKFDYLVLKHYNISVRGCLWDTMLMHYLIDPEAPHNMDFLARTYLDYAPVPIEDLIGKKGKTQGCMGDVPLAQIADYAAEDADVTLRLCDALAPLLAQSGLTDLYLNVEAPLIAVLGDMEHEGVCIDSNALLALKEEMTAALAALEAEIRTMADEPLLNIFSPKQLGEALFDKMKIAENARTTSKSKQYSTSEETLAALKDKHPIVPKILEARSVKKLLSAYVESLPELVSPLTHRIHTSFHQAVTATGRLSSSNPNLQNIPIREAEGRKIRRAFIPSSPDRLLLSADYSQVELRIMAHLSGDQNLLQAFADNEDIHAATAAKIFRIPINQVTPEQRRQAKTANFGIIYGISAFGLAQRLDIPRGDARLLIDGYFAAYPKVRAYMDEMVQTARRRRYVTTICGRRRMLPAIDAGNAVERGFAERNAINAPIQGSAADIIKIAMIKIARRMQDASLASRMLLQVHDELVFDVPRPELDTMQILVKEEMERAYILRIPLVAEVGIGDNWLEAH